MSGYKFQAKATWEATHRYVSMHPPEWLLKGWSVERDVMERQLKQNRENQ